MTYASISALPCLRPIPAMRVLALLLVLASVPLATAPLASAQSGVQDIQLRVLRNDAVDGGRLQIAILIRTASRTPNNTLGSSTVDIAYDAAHVTPISVGNTPTFYSSTVTAVTCPVTGDACVRFNSTGSNVSPAAPGLAVGSEFETLGTLTFVLDATSAAGTTLSINEQTLSVGYFDTENNASADGRIEDNTGAVGDDDMRFAPVADLTTVPPAFQVTSPLADDYFGWGDPINVRWTTLDPTITPSDRVSITLLCPGEAPYVRFADVDNSGARGFLMPEPVGVHGGPGDLSGSCRAEVALVSDPAQLGLSDAIVVQDDALAVAVTEPERLDRYGIGDPFTWRWDPADLPSGASARLSLLCEGRAEWVRFTATPNDGAQGVLLPTDFGAWDNCHAQVTASTDFTVYGRSPSIEILDVPLPSVEITAPASADVLAAGTATDIEWTTLSTDPSVSLRILLDDFSTPSVTTVRLAQTDNDGTFTWSIPPTQAPGTQYRVRIAGFALDGTRIVDVTDVFEIEAPVAPIARASRGLAPSATGIPLDRGWTRIVAPTATDAGVWLATLLPSAERVVARDDAGRIVSVTADGALGDLGALAAGHALDVWVDAAATLGDAPRATARAVRTPRVQTSRTAPMLDAPAALWTVAAPGLADGDELAVRDADGRIVGRGWVRSERADVVVTGGDLDALPTADGDAAPARASKAPADGGPLRLEALVTGEAFASEVALADGETLTFVPGPEVTLVATLAATPTARLVADDAPLTAAVPETFSVEALAPNPTRARTRLRIALPDAGPLTAAVYDARGRRVAVLADGSERAAGWAEFTLDASRLAAGVYVVRVQTAADVATQTLTVVR